MNNSAPILNRRNLLRRGQALVEMMIMLPLLLVCALAIFQIYEMVDKKQKTQAASYFAIRASVMDKHYKHYTGDNLKNKVRDVYFSDTDDLEIDVHYKAAKTFEELIAYLTVASPFEIPHSGNAKVTCRFDPIYRDFPLLQHIFDPITEDGKLHVESESRMVGALLN